MSFEEDFRKIFADDLGNTKKAGQIYAGLANNRWQKDDQIVSYSWRAAAGLVAGARNDLDLEIADPDICQLCDKNIKDHLLEERKTKPFFTDKELTFNYYHCPDNSGNQFISGYLGPEDYLDFYCFGDEGTVADWIEERFGQAGYKKLSN
jgi:hypothetical protein